MGCACQLLIKKMIMMMMVGKSQRQRPTGTLLGSVRQYSKVKVNTQTHTVTDHAIWDICSEMPHLCTACRRCDLVKIAQRGTKVYTPKSITLPSNFQSVDICYTLLLLRNKLGLVCPRLSSQFQPINKPHIGKHTILYDVAFLKNQFTT